MTAPTQATLPAGPQPTLAVGAVVVVADHILLVTRVNPPAQGRWTVPGGRVDPGERMAEAVVREVAEETGLVVACGGLIGWVERIGPDFHFVIFDFHAEPVGIPAGARPADLPLIPGDDAGDAAWVPLVDIGSMDLVSGLLDFLVEHGVVTGSR